MSTLEEGGDLSAQAEQRQGAEHAERIAREGTISQEETLLAFDEHGRVEGTLPRDGGEGDETVAAYGRAGIDVAALASRLQTQGAKSFDESWQDLLDAIGTKSQALA